jgi:SAM-dependent methyltransferase
MESTRNRIRPFVERAHRFSGWRLDEFTPRPLEPRPPWSYETRAAELLREAKSVLDMGTGGGELLETLSASFRGRAVATEPWSVNAPVAAARLGPHGISVVQCSSLQLPFRDASFDAVLNRHEELDPAEVARVLYARGSVLTQQIGRDRWRELRPFFPRMQDFGDLFHRYENGLKDYGLTIVQARSHEWKAVYRGLGDIVFLLCVAPWEITEFDPLGGDLPALLAAEKALSTDQGIVLTESRFLLEAKRDSE